MKKSRPTSLKDLADELRVSISTVSRALKNSSEISQDTKEKVQELAKRWKYRPNPFAMGLLNNSPRIIGIIVPDIATTFFSSIVSAINKKAYREGYSTIITSSYEQYLIEKQCVETLINLRVDGILACVSQETVDFSHFELLHDLGVPLVFFDRVALTSKFSHVISDNIETAQKTTSHLIENGAKRIGFIGGANHISIVKLRKHGYLEALREHKIAIDRNLVFCKAIDYEAGYEGVSQLLNLANPPDALFCISESLTFGALKAIREKNLRIPNDIAIVGYLDNIHSDYVIPTLTAVKHQTLKMGETAFDLLLKQIMGQKKIEKKVIPCILKIRDTSKKTSE